MARKWPVVGAERFELPTLWSQTRCATRLRYAPNTVFRQTIPDWWGVVTGKHTVRARGFPLMSD